MIIETDRLEQEIESGSTYLDCFKKINIRRTEVAVGVYTIQVLSGIYLVGYATYFFSRESLSNMHFYSPEWLTCVKLPVSQMTKLSTWA